jgi:hypothetical protein
MSRGLKLIHPGGWVRCQPLLGKWGRRLAIRRACSVAACRAPRRGFTSSGECLSALAAWATCPRTARPSRVRLVDDEELSPEDEERAERIMPDYGDLGGRRGHL